MSICFTSNQVSFSSEECKRNYISSALQVTTIGIHPKPTSKLDICIIGQPFMSLTRKKMVQLFSVSLHKINIALGEKKKRNPKEIVYTEYHELLSLFSETGRNTLLPNRKYYFQIDLKEGKEPSFGPLY